MLISRARERYEARRLEARYRFLSFHSNSLSLASSSLRPRRRSPEARRNRAVVAVAGFDVTFPDRLQGSKQQFLPLQKCCLKFSIFEEMSSPR